MASVTKDCKTDDERAIAIYNFCRYDHYHHAYPSEPGGISALKLINVYGWSLCGGEHTVMAALWEADIIAKRKSLLYLQSLKLLQTTLDRVLPED